LEYDGAFLEVREVFTPGSDVLREGVFNDFYLRGVCVDVAYEVVFSCVADGCYFLQSSEGYDGPYLFQEECFEVPPCFAAFVEDDVVYGEGCFFFWEEEREVVYVSGNVVDVGFQPSEFADGFEQRRVCVIHYGFDACVLEGGGDGIEYVFDAVSFSVFGAEDVADCHGFSFFVKKMSMM
jgi:hypothetical protein